MPIPFLDKFIGSAVGETFQKVARVFKADPTAVAEAESEVEKLKLTLAGQIEDAVAREVETVNATMREEAKSEHWLQWSWRPTIGFAFSAMIVNNYVLLPYFPQLHAIDIPAQAWLSMLSILGISAGTRGWKQILEAKNGK